jgi:O-antigen ligase
MANYFNFYRSPTIVLAIVAGIVAGLIAAAGIIWPLLLIGTLGVLYLVYLRTEFGPAVMVFITYINLSDVLIKHHGFPSVAKVYVPLMMLLLGFEWLRYRRQPWLPIKGLLVLAVYSLVLLLSFFYAHDDQAVADGLLQYSKNLTIALLLALLASSPINMRLILWSIIAGAFFLGALSVIKFLTGNFANDFGGFAQAKFEMRAQAQWIRYSGPIGDPNHFAQFILIAVPISFERMLSEKKSLLKFAAACALLVSIFAILMTFSRGALVSLAIVTFMALYMLRAHRKWLVVGILLSVVVALPLLPDIYIDRLTSVAPAVGFEVDGPQTADSSTSSRIGLMKTAWNMFLDHPILGVGYRNFLANYQEYALLYDLRRGGGDISAHTLYLEIAAETGLIGLMSFGLLLLYLGKVSFHGWTTMRQAGFYSVASMIAGLATGLLAYLIAATFLHDAYPRYFWMLAGLLLAVPGLVKNTLPEREERLRP